jgi:hypothetical protein
MQPTEDEIRTLAYELWVAAGRPEGRQQEFWIEAERQLRQQPLPGSIEE